MIDLESSIKQEEINASLQAQLFYEESLPKTPISLSPPKDFPPTYNWSLPHVSNHPPLFPINQSSPHSNGNKRRICVIRCKPMVTFVTRCEFCPKRFELCWMCIEDHVDRCCACKQLEAEDLLSTALLEEHESLQMDLKRESDIAQESKEGLIMDYKSLEDYENSLPPTPKDLILYSTIKTSCSMDSLNNPRPSPQGSANDLFTGRGSHPLTHSPDIEKVFLAQLDIWSSPSKISVIIPECMSLFDSIGNAEDGYNISYLFHKAIKAVQNNLPHHPKSYKQALMGDFGGSGPHRGSPVIITNPAPKTQFTTVTLLDSTVTYSVQFNSHVSRGSVVLIDGHSQSKCSTLKAVHNRLNSSAPLFELLLNAPMFVPENLDDFDRNKIIHK